MGKTNLILLLLWLPQATLQLLTSIYWLQTKEYRWDRFRLLLQSTSGRRAILLPLIVGKVVLLGLLGGSYWLVLTIFVLADSYLIYKVVTHGLVRPANTARGLLVLVMCVFGIGYLLLRAESFLVLELALVVVPVVASVITGMAVKYVEFKRKNTAKLTVESSGAKVVGITGSYGKTTTKKFTKELLEQKYKVVATYKNANTPLMIYGTLASSPKPDVYVVEMGAYRKGEIANLASVAQPDIGILTAVEEQHMSLFGSLQAIKDAKFELIESIKPGGTAIFNISNKNVATLVKRARSTRPDLKVITYSSRNKHAADYSMRVLRSTDSEIVFEVKTDNVSHEFSTKLPAEFLIENVLGAICAARELGVTWSQVAAGVAGLTTYDQIMSVHELANDLTIIDDSKNSPPTGFYAALERLATYNKPKIVVTTGTIELGSVSHRVHREFAKRMAEIGVTKVFLTNEEFFVDFKSVLAKSNVDLTLIKGKAGMAELWKLPKTNCAVLLEGRLPPHIRGIFL